MRFVTPAYCLKHSICVMNIEQAKQLCFRPDIRLQSSKGGGISGLGGPVGELRLENFIQSKANLVQLFI